MDKRVRVVWQTAALVVLLGACDSFARAVNGGGHAHGAGGHAAGAGPAQGGTLGPGEPAATGGATSAGLPPTGGAAPGGGLGSGGVAGAASGNSLGSGGVAGTASGGGFGSGGTVSAGSGGGTVGTWDASGSGGASGPTGAGGTAGPGDSDVGGSSGPGGSNVGGSSGPGGNRDSGSPAATGGTARDAGTAGAKAEGGSSGSADVGGAVSTGGSTSTGYHQLPGWTGARANPDHHGRAYFLANGQKDDKGVACTTCHGANLDGGAGPSCASCHSTWRTCTFCHGNASTSQIHPPTGVSDESTTATLAVGRHVAHLSDGNSHPAFACTTCHTVPASNDISHTLPYQPSADLSTTGHHGDVAFFGLGVIWNGTTWTVTAASGSTARGTCTGACHSNGRSGAPAKTPYWAGGSWTTGCTNCHGATGQTGGNHGHGFPGSQCGDCHTGASSTSYTAATHMNGKRDFRSNPGGAASGATLTVSGSGWNCANSPCHESGGD
jgi:predicted CxxxxCH...CXXCH cytochrome family protein